MLLTPLEFDSFEEFNELEQELEDEEIRQAIRFMEPVQCEREVREIICREFEEVFQKHGFEEFDMGYGLIVTQKK